MLKISKIGHWQQVILVIYFTFVAYMKVFRLIIFKNLFLLTILFSLGCQSILSYHFDTSKISHFAVNGTENISN